MSSRPNRKVQMMPLALSTEDATPITEPSAAMMMSSVRASGSCSLNTVVMPMASTISPIRIPLNHLLKVFSVILSEAKNLLVV